jgi:hypothetical protein
MSQTVTVTRKKISDLLNLADLPGKKISDPPTLVDFTLIKVSNPLILAIN